MSQDDDDLKSVSEAMAEWDNLLPPNHGGRTLVAGLHALESGELEHAPLEGSDETVGATWLSILSLGTVANGALKYFIYPAAETNEDLLHRDTLLTAIEDRPESESDPMAVVAETVPPSTTLALAYFGLYQGARAIGVAWNRRYDRRTAIGRLKLVIRRIRENEAAAAKGGS